MITIRPVVREDLDPLFGLSVRPDQQKFVAPNPVTLAEFAYLSGSYVFTIRNHDEIVGLMGIVDFREHDELEKGDDPNAAFLMRLMVGAKHQNQGNGRAALTQGIAWAKARQNTCFQTSIVPGNESALRFYESFGMRKTGRIVEQEIELSVNLK